MAIRQFEFGVDVKGMQHTHPQRPDEQPQWQRRKRKLPHLLRSIDPPCLQGNRMNGCGCRGWCSSGAEPSRDPHRGFPKGEDTKIAQDKRERCPGQHRKLVFAPRRGRGEEFNDRPSCSIKRPPCLAAPVQPQYHFLRHSCTICCYPHICAGEDSDGRALSDSISNRRSDLYHPGFGELFYCETLRKSVPPRSRASASFFCVA